ncbi:MAG: aminotransferase class V-fold PLP-dependent enzyme [Actinobacteria bacterium]|nr:MAG: aminotransferase class V-fold PLP-dependent enzyme [Actinomycetota bacterium]
MAYLDAAAGAPPHPVARQALLAAQEDGWADPGKLYPQGRRARQLLDAARGAIADQLGVRADEVLFCASGTDAVQAAVLGFRAGATIVHSAIEHSALLHAVADRSAVSVPVDRLGRVDVAAFTAAVREPGVGVAALISASHEVGTVQPVAEVAAACAAAGIPLVVDAAQSVGRVPVPDGWAVLAASAHKWGGPAGVGVLVVHKGTRWVPPWPGADPAAPDQPGTRNLPALVAAAAALRAAGAEADAEARRLYPLVERIRTRVAASLDRAGFAVSSGSSCTSSTLRPSHVLEAMGVLSHGNVRVSLHRDTTEAEVDAFLDVLPGLVADLRAQAGVAGL